MRNLILVAAMLAVVGCQTGNRSGGIGSGGQPHQPLAVVRTATVPTIPATQARAPAWLWTVIRTESGATIAAPGSAFLARVTEGGSTQVVVDEIVDVSAFPLIRYRRWPVRDMSPSLDEMVQQLQRQLAEQPPAQTDSGPGRRDYAVDGVTVTLASLRGGDQSDLQIAENGPSVLLTPIVVSFAEPEERTEYYFCMICGGGTETGGRYTIQSARLGQAMAAGVNAAPMTVTRRRVGGGSGPWDHVYETVGLGEVLTPLASELAWARTQRVTNRSFDGWEGEATLHHSDRLGWAMKIIADSTDGNGSLTYETIGPVAAIPELADEIDIEDVNWGERFEDEGAIVLDNELGDHVILRSWRGIEGARHFLVLEGELHPDPIWNMIVRNAERLPLFHWRDVEPDPNASPLGIPADIFERGQE